VLHEGACGPNARWPCSGTRLPPTTGAGGSPLPRIAAVTPLVVVAPSMVLLLSAERSEDRLAPERAEVH
jgi:hypothetical protein